VSESAHNPTGGCFALAILADRLWSAALEIWTGTGLQGTKFYAMKDMDSGKIGR
jgi:hypothetical protein